MIVLRCILLLQEDMERLSGVRTLVSQLYESLNVEEHQLIKERELLAKMEALKVKLEPLEKVRDDIYYPTLKMYIFSNVQYYTFFPLQNYLTTVLI